MSKTVTVGPRTRVGVAAALALALSVPCTALAAPLAPAGERSAGCPTPGKEPGIGHVPLFTDAGVALYAGGDYTADGGTAEAEGLLVVGGHATFAKTAGGVFNVGRVGAGSGILPASGELMLAVGGDLGIAKGTTVDVGHGLTAGPRYGGSVRVGGKIDEKGSLTTNGGSLSSGTGAREALGPYAAFGGTVRRESASLAALRPTGTSVRSGGTVTFEGRGAAAPQVFEISAGDIDGASTFLFRSLPEGAAVVINVKGGQAVGISPLSVGINGDRVDTYDSPRFGEAASRILYNFEESASIRLGGGGNFMGLILAPEADADLTASTNGRLYAGGDIRTHGAGNESHNYPWVGSSVFGCEPTPEGPGGGAPQPEPSRPAPSPSRPGGGGATPAQPAEPAPTPVASTATPSPSEPTPVPSTTPPAGGKRDGSLATTGGQTAPYLLAAAALGVPGGVFLLVPRRRRVRR
ncbi:choice-of-anchor A family protein [Streptomyces sp. NPDC048018]|uniref:choice-of-anchor A family protein n=1 Tax=Streptomyces sp. NPDC048018 TaxID=3365499 RepID=UPI003718C460